MIAWLCEYIKLYWIVYSKCVIFMVGKLYLGKAFTKKVFPSELDKNLSQEW